MELGELLLVLTRQMVEWVAVDTPCAETRVIFSVGAGRTQL